MWNNISNIIKAASAMLNSGQVPPNTPPRYKEDLSKINFLSSKKFYVVFCSVIILSIFSFSSFEILLNIFCSENISFVSV